MDEQTPDPRVITANLGDREAKLIRKAKLIADAKQLEAILASFPEDRRAALREQVKPLLRFSIA